MASDPWNAANRTDLAFVRAVVENWLPAAASSALYTSFGRAILDDEPMLRLLGRIDNLPPMNLLLGAVKLWLTPSDALAAWYPHLAGDAAREPSPEAYALLRDYALARADAVAGVGAARRTQTNEVGRSAAILPWLAEAARTWGEPVHLVDVGASAGLNLCLDRFDYRYGSHAVATVNPASVRLEIACENRGGFDLPDAAPRVASRSGIDLMPVDALDPDASAWLEALVWPEHTARLERLRAAIAIRRETDVAMHAGDAVTLLGELHESLPPGPMLVFHTVMAYQLSAAQHQALDAAVASIGAARPVARVAMEPRSFTAEPLISTGLAYPGGTSRAMAQAHGAWIGAVPA